LCGCFSKEHPLAIFFDDLQWIDSATLKLIELMLLDEQTQYLFLIGAIEIMKCIQRIHWF